MSIDEMVEGPGSAQPDTSGPWSVVSGKTVGRTTGFTIMDPAGERFVIKFDVQTWPEMGSSAEAVSTLIFHAAGYSVPRNSVVFFLTVSIGAIFRGLDALPGRVRTSYDPG